MKLTQKDYEERVARLADGTSPDPDDDRRLVKHYERQGARDEMNAMIDVQSWDAHENNEPKSKPESKPRGARRNNRIV